VVVLALAAIVMMMVDHRQHHMDTIRGVLAVVVYPIHYLVNVPGAARQWLGDSLASRHSLEQENRELNEKQLLLQAQLLKLESLEAENNRLRELLDSSAKVGQPVLVAELMSVDMAPYSRQVVLNKGSHDQVVEGQPILDAAGVMGQVIRVTPFSSTVMLITDPNAAVPVQVNRSGLRAIVRGTGDQTRVELSLLPRSADIQEGDLLVTSGLDGRFPPGYPVARVTAIERGIENPFLRVSAEPAARLDSTRVVLLVLPPPEPAPASETAAAPKAKTKETAKADTAPAPRTRR
jgi:rod shape-determining protein MreC